MKTLLTMFCIVCSTCLLKAQNLKQAEYFIDKDKGVGKNTKLNLAGNNDSSYNINVDVSNISVGFHKLYIRVKDTKGEWSLALNRSIEVVASEVQPNIIAGEYFFDKDLGVGRGKQISISSQDTLITNDFIAATATLTNGMHKLYTRFKDSSGKWSETNKRNVEIIRTADTVKIIAAEYFFSGDKGFDHDVSKLFSTSAEDGKFKFKIPYSKIPANADTLFIRAEDSLGNWSLTKLSLFSVQSFANNAIATTIQTNKDELKVFPNPACNFINYYFKGINSTSEITIVNINGELVKKYPASSSESGQINISDLSAGTYFIQINDGKTTRSVKFIKQ